MHGHNFARYGHFLRKLTKLCHYVSKYTVGHFFLKFENVSMHESNDNLVFKIDLNYFSSVSHFPESEIREEI